MVAGFLVFAFSEAVSCDGACDEHLPSHFPFVPKKPKPQNTEEARQAIQTARPSVLSLISPWCQPRCLRPVEVVVVTHGLQLLSRVLARSCRKRFSKSALRGFSLSIGRLRRRVVRWLNDMLMASSYRTPTRHRRNCELARINY